MKSFLFGLVPLFIILVLVSGCPQTSFPDPNAGTPTANEYGAIGTALDSIRSIVTSVDNTQGVTGGGEGNQSALNNTPRCPEALFALASGAVLTVSVDFGPAGCQPFAAENLTCSGSAGGTLNPVAQTLQMQFDDLSCDGQTLDGTIDASYEHSTSAVSLAGSWSLSYQTTAHEVLTTGEGEASCDPQLASTTIRQFDGTVAADGSECAAILENVSVSYQQYGNFVPFAGQATLTGTDIRDIVILFDASSPSTGLVQVSVNGSPFVSVSLFSL